MAWDIGAFMTYTIKTVVAKLVRYAVERKIWSLDMSDQ
jgi:hypothetical protein